MPAGGIRVDRKKKSRFKPKRVLIRSFALSDIDDWIPSNAEERRFIRKKIESMSKSDFDKIALRIMHYPIWELFLSSADEALANRTKFYLEQLKLDILKLSGPASVNRTNKLNAQIDKHFLQIEKAISKLWTDPNTIQTNRFQYRNAFDNIVELSNGDRQFSSKLRERIKYEFYNTIDNLKWIFDVRYPNSNRDYEDFLRDNLFSNVDLSNFLRGGRAQKNEMDIKDFNDSRRRFLKSYSRKKRQ